MSAISRSAACFSCTASAVSSTSELVMPWCSQRRSGPSFSPAQVRKAITSCLVTASIASIASMSICPAHRGRKPRGSSPHPRPGSSRSCPSPRPRTPRSATRCGSGSRPTRWPSFRGGNSGGPWPRRLAGKPRGFKCGRRKDHDTAQVELNSEQPMTIVRFETFVRNGSKANVRSAQSRACSSGPAPPRSHDRAPSPSCADPPPRVAGQADVLLVRASGRRSGGCGR